MGGGCARRCARAQRSRTRRLRVAGRAGWPPIDLYGGGALIGNTSTRTAPSRSTVHVSEVGWSLQNSPSMLNCAVTAAPLGSNRSVISPAGSVSVHSISFEPPLFWTSTQSSPAGSECTAPAILPAPWIRTVSAWFVDEPPPQAPRQRIAITSRLGIVASIPVLVG